METTTVQGYEIAGANDWMAEGSEAYRRDAASRYGAASAQDVYGLIFAHYEWNLSRLGVAERSLALDLLIEGYEAARAEADSAAASWTVRY